MGSIDTDCMAMGSTACSSLDTDWQWAAQHAKHGSKHCRPALPLTEPTLCQFAAVMAQTVSWGTIRVYLSAVRFFQIQAGLPDPSLAAFPRLTYVLKGIHRTTPEHRRKHRLPITLHILRAIHGVWSTPPISYNHVMLWAACCTGFFGFLCSGEFTCPAANIADPPPPPTPSDISIDSRENPQVITIHLRRTKTDPFGVGCKVYLGRTRMTPCPVAAMLHYLAARPSAHGPLFTFEDGDPLTRAALVTHLQTAFSFCCLHPSIYKRSCCRSP